MSTHYHRTDWDWTTLGLLLIVQLWAAHAVAFFLHEYAHSFTAWLLGWKMNPFALDYAHPTLVVFLAQLGINQNVDEIPIFASGHAHDAALIAGAGMVIGNGLLSYSLSRLGYCVAKKRNYRRWALFFYWTTVASIGNFIDYVPVRTFTDDGDMYSLERGFGWSPWAVLIILGLPTAAALTYFLLKIQPSSLAWLFPSASLKRTLLVVLTGVALFGFYGATGLIEGGPISHVLSVISVRIVLPLATFGSWFLVRREASVSAHI